MFALSFHLALLLGAVFYHPIWQEVDGLASDTQVSLLPTGLKLSKIFEHKVFSSQKV